MGQITLRQGKKNDAIVLFETAAQLNPSDYESLQNLAVAYRETGRVADAESVLNSISEVGRAVRAGPELGMVCYQKGDPSAALRYFEQAAQLGQYKLEAGAFVRPGMQIGRNTPAAGTRTVM